MILSLANFALVLPELGSVVPFSVPIPFVNPFLAEVRFSSFELGSGSPFVLTIC